MDNKLGIDFKDLNSRSTIWETQSSDRFSQIELVEFSEPERKHSLTKKIKQITKSQEQMKNQVIEVVFQFGISIQLINLLRNPVTIQQHIFEPKYLDSIGKALSSLVKPQTSSFDETVLYIHLVFAQVDNLSEMEELQEKDKVIVKFNAQAWNNTNIMSAKCILANLKHFDLLKPSNEPTSSGLNVEILKNEHAYLFNDKLIQISEDYVRLALEANGHLDIYFGPFLLNKFSFEASLWLNNFKDVNSSLLNYSTIYQQLAKEKKQVQSIKYNQWYAEQINKIIDKKFNSGDLRHILNNTNQQEQIERLLIGLLGWDDETEYAIKFLNVLYDNSDWQIYSQFNPTIEHCGNPFQINYLIEKITTQRENLAICVKAPCFNPYYNGESFSWHKPKLVQYVSDGQSYVWVQAHFGNFNKSGFYDWALFNLLDKGKETVNKILDIGIKNKVEKEFRNSSLQKRNVVSVRSVKGRFIVHPSFVKDLQLHEISIDSLNLDQAIYKTPTFADVYKQIGKIKQNKINCIYLMGVFQRDNQENNQVYKRPHASPTALTHRTVPCRMLGGTEQFKRLVDKCHDLGIKVIVDATTRVSSSRMSKKYDNLRLHNIDDQGRKVYHYGSNGRSISYEDTTILNYRKKQSWDLLMSEILQIIKLYKIDGIYLDNGFEWPQIFKINEQEMFRVENMQTPAYSIEQIFQGSIVDPNKLAGYWPSRLSNIYPNPFYVKLCKKLWEINPQFLIISEGLQIEDNDLKLISVIKSGAIPRLFKMPKALSQIVGTNLHSTGQITYSNPKNISNLKKWYQQVLKSLPKNSIIIHSTTSPVWPYLAYIFKKATWAVIDLYFMLPGITITSGLEEYGKVYKTKTLNINYIFNDSDKKDHIEVLSTRKQKSFNKANSNYFLQESVYRGKKGNIVTCVNMSLKDPSQIKSLEENFRKEVGPQFGFDLAQIHKHYLHRRELREKFDLFREGRLILVSAEHLYGVHNNVLSFIRYNEAEMLLISINFNADPIDMHYNLTALKHLFKNHERSNIVIQLEDVLNPTKFQDEFYLVSELIASRIQARIESYKTIIWKLSIMKENKIAEAEKCSIKRMKEKISRTPPHWIYSSLFFQELSHLLENAKSKLGIVKGLNLLYENFILPEDLNFSLVISKNYDFYINKTKLQKLFGVFKLISGNEHLNEVLKDYISNMLIGNILGPIAFVTPEIGSWSTVGGLGVMVDELSKELVRLGQEVYIITPYYEYNKKKQTNYLLRDGFQYERNIDVFAAQFQLQFGIHRGKYCGVNYIWFHNPELFSKPYEGEGALYVTKQLVFFASAVLESFCQLKIFPSLIVTNDWMCGFVSAYVKVNKYKEIFNGSKFMHIVHNLDSLYQGKLYPKVEEGNLNWLIQLPSEWYIEYKNNRMVINPSKCALQTCDNWGTVSHSYKYDLLRESNLAPVLWKHPHPFSFPNGIRKEERLSILHTKTPGNHLDSKKLLQKKYFKCEQLRNQVPLFAFIGRITKQKGVHLILDSIEALLYENNFKIQILVGGGADSKEQYGKYCADKMRYLNNKYPHCFWSNPDLFFTDGPLVNIGSDFALMPSLFQPGGIVQHEFFCGGTPVITFKTGGLKDTVFEYDMNTLKGNGFNFMSYDLQDYKACMRRAINCYKNKQAYEKLRQNAFESVIQEQDVAKGWNNQFYRLQNKVYIDWQKVQKQTDKFTKHKDDEVKSQEQIENINILKFKEGGYWKKQWENIECFKEVLKNASRLKVKSHNFCYKTDKIPRPKQVFIAGNWDDWKTQTKLNFDKIQKNYKISLKLKPGNYHYKYLVDGQWVLTEHQESDFDVNNIQNHIVAIE